MLTIDNLIGLVTLTSLEIVLGIDNLVFIAILTSRLPLEQQSRARKLGLGLAMVMRILLLLSLGWVMRLTEPIMDLFGHAVSGRDVILLGGGLFLLAKATLEIHEKIEAKPGEKAVAPVASVASAITQIMLLDIVFSLDSVITAVGMVSEIWIMVVAIIAAVVVMLLFADSVSEFIKRHQTIQMLALSFLILIGVFLMAEGVGQHIDRGYLYFAMAFSLFVEFLNMRARRSVSG